VSEPRALTLMEGRIVDGHVVIPRGMTPKYVQSLNGKMITYVHGWAAAGEYDQNSFDLYPLGTAHHLRFKVNGESEDQDWYQDFGAQLKRQGEMMRTAAYWFMNSLPGINHLNIVVQFDDTAEAAVTARLTAD
jgi:hypothetical protein